MTSPALERHQVWLYVVAILAGLGVGHAAPVLAPLFEAVLWPALGFLLYVTMQYDWVAYDPAQRLVVFEGQDGGLPHPATFEVGSPRASASKCNASAVFSS